MKNLTVLAALVLSAIPALFAPGAPAPSAPSRDMVVALQGTATGTTQVIATPNGPTEAMCFTVDMIDLETGEVIGEGTDCLTNIQENGEGLSLLDYTIFEFAGGTLVTESFVSVRPVAIPLDDVTHLTGSFPSPGDNNVLRGTGRFAGAEASVRLSGGVDMGSLESDGAMTFNCIFVIDFED